jgi:hypothetical protein
LIFLIQSFSQNHAADPLSKHYSFGYVTDGSLFKALSLLDQDSINRSLTNACILGTKLDELRDYNFPDLEKRIEKLVVSGILKLNEEKNDPAEIWLIYPQHPFMVGTQQIDADRNAQITVSWNNHCLHDLQSISEVRNIRLSGALNNDFSKENSKVLGKYGFSIESGNKRIFSYGEGDRIDRLCKDCTKELLPAFASLYDFKSLGQTFEIPEKEIFLIVLHETAYSLFENMQQLNKLELPLALRNDSSSATMVRLVSVKLAGNK